MLPSVFEDGLDCFRVEDPCTIDALSMIGAERENRRRLHEWDLRQSDIDGCSELHSAKVLVAKTPLHKKEAPILAMLDALANMEFIGVSGGPTPRIGRYTLVRLV